MEGGADGVTDVVSSDSFTMQACIEEQTAVEMRIAGDTEREKRRRRTAKDCADCVDSVVYLIETIFTSMLQNIQIAGVFFFFFLTR